MLQSMKKTKQDEIYGESPSDKIAVDLEEAPDLNKINEALSEIVELNTIVIIAP